VKLPDCDNCGSKDGIRQILWSDSLTEIDTKGFVLGGSNPGNAPASLRCLDCGWEDNQPRWKRFISESLDGISFQCRTCGNWIEAKDLGIHGPCQAEKRDKRRVNDSSSDHQKS
jgi:hypothetical protein